jgi:hypothetical protein
MGVLVLGDLDILSDRQGYSESILNYRFDPKYHEFDFDIGNQTLEEVLRALKSKSAGIRMKAIIAMAHRKDVTQDAILAVNDLWNDNGYQEVESHYGRVRFVPEVGHCCQIFLPLIGQNSPKAVQSLLNQVTSQEYGDNTELANAISHLGVTAIAIALATMSPENGISPSKIKFALWNNDYTGQIRVLLDVFIDNPFNRVVSVTQFLSSSRLCLFEFMLGVSEYGVIGDQWISEGLKYVREKDLSYFFAGKISSPKTCVLALVQAMSSKDKKVREASAYALSRYGKGHGEAVTAFKQALEGETGWWARHKLNGYLRQVEGK